jgi:hypothetical protein
MLLRDRLYRTLGLSPAYQQQQPQSQQQQQPTVSHTPSRLPAVTRQPPFPGQVNRSIVLALRGNIVLPYALHNKIMPICDLFRFLCFRKKELNPVTQLMLLPGLLSSIMVPDRVSRCISITQNNKVLMIYFINKVNY